MRSINYQKMKLWDSSDVFARPPYPATSRSKKQTHFVLIIIVRTDIIVWFSVFNVKSRDGEQKEEYFHKQAREIAFANKRWQNNFPLSADDTIPLRYYVSINDAIAGALWVTRNGRKFWGNARVGDEIYADHATPVAAPPGAFINYWRAQRVVALKFDIR